MEPKKYFSNEKDNLYEILKESVMAEYSSNAQFSIDNILPVEAEMPSHFIFMGLTVYIF